VGVECDASWLPGDNLLLISPDWLLRGLLGIGGAIVAFVAWLVSQGAWQAQYTDAVATKLRLGYPVPLGAIVGAIEALDRAVAADSTASRRMQRAEMLVAAALVPSLEAMQADRREWLKRAEADLELALGDNPARGVEWLRLAGVRQLLDGPSQAAVAPLLMSIETAPMMAPIWPARLRLILDNRAAFTPEQREAVSAYVATTWRLSPDRRWFGEAIRSPVDELFVRYFVRNEPGAQEALTKLLAVPKK